MTPRPIPDQPPRDARAITARVPPMDCLIWNPETLFWFRLYGSAGAGTARAFEPRGPQQHAAANVPKIAGTADLWLGFISLRMQRSNQQTENSSVRDLST